MDTLLSMKVFCQVVQSGSFTRAAGLLDISIPMASKHVSHLEKTIGAQLLYRNNRSLKLTDQGDAYYRDCQSALELLAQAAENALTKIRSVFPPWLSHTAANAQFSIAPAPQYSAAEAHALAQIRQALREHRRLIIGYTDQHNRPSHRQIQPIVLGYFAEVRLLAAWCEQRQDFRHFRCDRIQSIALGDPSPMPHELLLRQWQQHENIRMPDY